MAFRRFARGKVRPDSRGKMNGLEREYANILQARLLAGEILWWRREGMNLQLSETDTAYYKGDFIVQALDGTIEIHETKGHWEHEALLRIKFAAEVWPFKFIAIGKKTKKEGGGWWVREFGEVQK